MRRFAFNYYVGMLLFVFILYASFLRAVVEVFRWWLIGVLAGALAIVMLLFAIYVAWKAHDETEA